MVDRPTADEAERAALEERVRQLERANRELEGFASIVSHELKQPLHGIRCFAQLLLEGPGVRPDAPISDKLERIVRMTQRMDELIGALIDYARLGGSRQSEVADLAQVMAEVLEIAEPLADLAGAKLALQGRPPRVRCAPAAAGVVLRNLISNALKYGQREAPAVDIGWCSPGEAPAGLENPHAWPVGYVRDNGIGIPERHREDVFRMFRRLHARGEYGGGLGIGLAVAKRIVELHGGHIHVESLEGAGSTFWYTLGPPAD